MADGPVAILPWSDLIEDFLDHVGVSLERFSEEMSGGWLFGYVSALQQEGFDSLLVLFSARYRTPRHLTHVPTGAPIVVLPASWLYRNVRKWARNPYGANTREMFGETRGLRRLTGRALRPVIPYTGTPLLRLARLLRREGCSVILCQEYEYARFDACAVLGRLLGLPVLTTCQGGTSPQSALERRIRPLTLRLASGVIIGSQKEADRVIRSYGVPADRVARIPNPIDVHEWTGADRDGARAELGIASEQVVAWHGRVDLFGKGLDVLLQAWAQVTQQRPRRVLRLLLIGTGRDAPELRRYVESLPEANVTWIDTYVLDKRRVAHLLAAADVYAFPSRVEGFPVAPLEAMARGLPVVAADAPGVGDIFDEGERSGGIVVPPGDAAAFAAALRRVLDDEELRRRLGRHARQRAESAFSVEAVGSELGRLLERCRVRPGRSASSVPLIE